MDNRVFNVNGRLHDKDQLLAALKLVIGQSGHRVTGWKFDKKKGLILSWYSEDGVVSFPACNGMTAESILPIVLEWLSSDEAKTVVLKGWDMNADHDGSNSPGWRVYCEDWGFVGDCHSAVCAITPAFCWHGK
jgi:hypothetical protein